jgi:hypothetical protein
MTCALVTIAVRCILARITIEKKRAKIDWSFFVSPFRRSRLVHILTEGWRRTAVAELEGLKIAD